MAAALYCPSTNIGQRLALVISEVPSGHRPDEPDHSVIKPVLFMSLDIGLETVFKSSAIGKKNGAAAGTRRNRVSAQNGNSA